MPLRHRIRDAVQSVPVFVKVMGIAMLVILLLSAGVFWQVRATGSAMLQQELRNSHTPEEIQVITEHMDSVIGRLNRRLARVVAVLAGLGILLAWLLAGILTHPLENLIAATRSVKEGKFSTRARVYADDEIGELARAFNDMATALEQKERLRQQLLRHATAAGEEEGKRLARELHDQSGQMLTALIAGITALESHTKDPQSVTKLKELRELAAQTLGEVHGVSLALRPSVLDDMGLAEALRRHCRDTGKRFGVETDFQATGLDEQRLPPETEVALYRIAQEAMTNAVRHGNPNSVQLTLHRNSNRLLMVVEDDGRGFDPSAQSGDATNERLGLLGIEERVAMLGGNVRVESAPGEGTRLYVEVPV